MTKKLGVVEYQNQQKKASGKGQAFYFVYKKEEERKPNIYMVKMGHIQRTRWGTPHWHQTDTSSYFTVAFKPSRALKALHEKLKSFQQARASRCPSMLTTSTVIPLHLTPTYFCSRARLSPHSSLSLTGTRTTTLIFTQRGGAVHMPWMCVILWKCVFLMCLCFFILCLCLFLMGLCVLLLDQCVFLTSLCVLLTGSVCPPTDSMCLANGAVCPPTWTALTSSHFSHLRGQDWVLCRPKG